MIAMEPLVVVDNWVQNPRMCLRFGRMGSLGIAGTCDDRSS